MEPTFHRRAFARKILIRALALFLIFTAFHFVYVIHNRSPCAGSSICFTQHVYQQIVSLGERGVSRRFAAYEESVQIHLRKSFNPDLKRLWTSRDWRKRVDLFSVLFSNLLKSEILHIGDKALCISAGDGQGVLALREIGIDSLGVDEVASLPLVIQGYAQRLPFPANSFDFEYSSSLDMPIPPVDACLEIERTLKPGGFAVIHLSKREENGIHKFDQFTQLFKDSDILHVKDIGSYNEVILRKRQQGTYDKYINFCSSSKHMKKLIEEAESLIMEEPRKPWITLKENAKNIKYLPSVTDIAGRDHYFYVDVGARSYSSSIGSWFVKKYPKQNQDFTIYAVEADNSFAADYKKRKNVKFLPYAAWLRNESLVFGANPENRAAEGEIGMGRIQGRSTLQNSQSGNFKSVQGFDFSEWLINTVTPDDFVVMKMDVEGTEFDLLPRMIETGAICLVDELFLECHYNRWQRSSPLRTTKYGKTYGECLSLFQALRNKGVLVHQWW